MKYLSVIPIIAVLFAQLAQAQDEDGYYGILNANESLIDSVSNQSGTLTGDFSTQSLLGPVERAQWATDGPVVVSTSGEVLGTLSTVESNTNSLFNESIYVQVSYMDRCEACIGSLNDNFSTEGPKIYDSQSAELKAKIEKLTGQPLGGGAVTFAEVNPEVGCTEGAWAKMKRVVLGIFHVLIFPSTWLCFALIAVLGVLYVMVPALLFDYLPSRVFGYRKGTPELDMALGTLLSVIGGLFIWGKVNRAREKKRLADKVEALRQRTGELQSNLIRVIEEKGRNHPETGYAYRELGKNMEALGQREQARQVHLQEREIFRETLGAASPEANYWKKLDLEPPVLIPPKPEVAQVGRTACGELEIFDTRRTLISIFGMLLGVSVMSAVIIGFGFGIELLLSIFK